MHPIRQRAARDPGSVLVTDSSLRTALCTIQSLGRHGVRITAAEREMPPMMDLGGISRYTSRRLRVADNRRDPETWVEQVLAAAGDHDVLLPIGMHAIVPVAQRLEDFRRATNVAIPDLSTVTRADSTPELLELARELEVPVPRQWKLSDFQDASDLAKDARFPLFVKLGVEADLPPQKRYARADSPDELYEALERLVPYNQHPVIQELVEGEAIGYETLYDFDHHPVAAFAHRRLREYPASGGPSTYCMSIHHPLAAEYSHRLLDALKWIGLAMVEFKIDARTGAPVLMEINPRPWGSMPLPVRAGVNFPWLWYLLARDNQLAEQPDWRDGVRLRFFVNDLQAALSQALQGGSVRERLLALASVVDPRVKEGVLSLRDPAPSLAYLTKGLLRGLRRR